jgi:murein DD-endopeptidase MepM/ murein hydrolase activator NlpD
MQVLAALALHLAIQAEHPGSVRQGEILRLQVSGIEAATAQFRDKRVPLFPQKDGRLLGLMPVKVLETPGTYPLEILTAGGEVLYTSSVTVADAGYAIQDIRATKKMKSLTASPQEREAIAAFRSTVSPRRFWTEPFLKPTPQCQNSPFGVQRYHNGQPSGNFHSGIDLRSPMGAPVKAAADGVVKISKMFRLHGGTIGIDHGQGVGTLYIHLSALKVPQGKRVRRGEIVGLVGSTGFSTGPHLHWAVYVHGLPVNPAQWLASEPRRCE